MISRHKQGPTSARRGEKDPTSATSDPHPSTHARLRGASITLAILAAALLFPSLFYPLARDQGVFAYVGSVILKGDWPYRDVWEVKPPGIYYTYAAILAATGPSMGGIRAFDLMAAVATALLLAAALWRLVAVEAAWLGALLYAALYLRLGFWGMAQAESYANLCTAVALCAWLVPRDGATGRRGDGGTVTGPVPGPEGRTRGEGLDQVAPSPHRPVAPSLAAGAATAAAMLLKVTALPPLAAALGVVSLLRIRREGGRRELQRLALYLLGLLVPLVWVAIAMARSGAGAAYLDIQRGFVAGYVAMPMSASGAAAAGWRYFWRLYWLPAALAGGGLLAARTSARLLLLAWLWASIASVAMQHKYFGYHWTPVLMPLAALAGVALADALALLTERITTERVALQQAWIVCAVGALLIAGWSVGRPENGYGPTARVLTGRLRLESYWRRFGRPYHGDFSFLADAWAAAYIRGSTQPSDRVYIWGFEPLTLFLARRSAPTRFVFAVPLVAPWSPPRWREEFLRDLRADPPVLFGVMRHDAIPHASGRRDDSAAQLEQFPALRVFLHQNYRYETTIEDLTLYRRQPGPPPPGPAPARMAIEHD
jgi:hypothetical protein